MPTIEPTINTPTPGSFLTKREVCAMLQFSPRHVDNLIRSGMPHMKFGARRTRFERDDVLTWCKEKFSVRRLGNVAQPLHSAEAQPAKSPRKPRKQSAKSLSA